MLSESPLGNESATGTVEAVGRSRRLFRRLLAALLLVIAVALLMVVYHYQQRIAWLNSVEARSGWVGTDSGEELIWYRTLLGDRVMAHFDDVYVIVLREATDDDLHHVVRTPNLSRTYHLILELPRLTEEGWDTVAGLENLQSLEITHDDAFLQNGERLSRFKELGVLTISNIALSNVEQIDNLASLPNLRSLTFDRVTLSDLQLEAVAKLTRLTDLEISNTKLSGEQLPLLHPLKDLEYLNLINTGLTDAALPELPKFTKLTYLDLSSNPLTPDGLTPLESMKTLEMLYLEDMPGGWTAEDVKSLQSALPRCEIILE